MSGVVLTVVTVVFTEVMTVMTVVTVVTVREVVEVPPPLCVSADVLNTSPLVRQSDTK